MRLDQQGGVIGRSQDSDLCLPDPERFVSRRQAEIHYRDGGYFISDIGSGNPVSLNGAPVPRGRAEPIRDGDSLDIGDYSLSVTVHATAESTPPRFTYTRVEDEESTPEPFLTRPLHSVAQDVMPLSRAPLSAPDFFGDGPVPGSFDSMGLLADERAMPSFRGSESDVLPEIFGPMLSISLVPEDYDFLRDAPRTSEKPDNNLSCQLDSTLAASTSATTQPNQGRDVPRGSEYMTAKLRAADEILRGAKLDGAEFDQSAKLGIAYKAGELLREYTRGLMSVLLARSRIKAEFGLKRRPLATKGNNPLKVFPSVEECLVAMLNCKSRGFLPAATAVRDACDDVQAHELALMAASRAALLAVMRRFDPQTIEGHVKPKGLLDRLLPSRRRARAWSQFCQRYKKLGSDLDNDFQTLFGEEFISTYQDQVEKLQNQTN